MYTLQEIRVAESIGGVKLLIRYWEMAVVSLRAQYKLTKTAQNDWRVRRPQLAIATFSSDLRFSCRVRFLVSSLHIT